MQYQYEVTAKCPKKCGATRIHAFSWCCYDKMELRCPSCDAVKEISSKAGWKLINQKDTKDFFPLIGFAGKEQIFEKPWVVQGLGSEPPPAPKTRKTRRRASNR